ncbi:MAG: hypothetical protein AAF078_11120, partial [Planctomycetota bacterium]
ELRRSISMTYCTMNIMGMLKNAHLGRMVGVNVQADHPEAWERLRVGTAALLPALTGEQAWPHPQIKPLPRWYEAPMIRLAEGLMGYDGLSDRWLEHQGVPSFPGVMAAVQSPHVLPPPPKVRPMAPPAVSEA